MSSSSSQKLAIDFLLNEDSKSQLKLHKNFNSGNKHNDKKASSSTQVTNLETIPARTTRKLQDLDRHPSGSRTATEISPRSHRQRSSSNHQDCDPSSIPATKERNRAFTCEICSRVFTEKGNLNKHVSSVHLKEKTKVCPEPGCGKRFAFRDGLTRHVAHVHMNERQHQCLACGKDFKQLSHLAKHRRTVHKLEK